ncbi:copia protein [Lasius niger]|uniref:Copia protein n=1 Tax=Lasius niger TaxID=67767 RepID=A0A0J7K432_LASNI|nr:copia protein [Lasius niger]
MMAQGVKQENRIYRMLFRVRNSEEANVSTTDLKTWHERLGHINSKSICEMTKKGLVKGIQLSKKKDFFCEPCQFGKLHWLPFKGTLKSYQPGELICTDVCGPMSVHSLGGARYFVLFKDDASAM